MTPSEAKRSILICFAHPDDESFGIGGTIAHYAQQGVEITLVCATKGEAGTVDPEFLENFASIAELRENELACAAQALGIQEVIYLGYRDSGMEGSADNDHKNAFAAADIGKVSKKLKSIIRKKRPQVLITFDSSGGYYHPDHIAIHQATLRAFEEIEVQSKPATLYFTARSRKKLRRLVRLMPLIGKDPKRVGRNKDIDLTRLAADEDTPPHVSIGYGSVLALKEQADRCHASQYGENGLSATFGGLMRRLGSNKDEFTRHFPPAADDFRSQDLFNP